MVIPGWVGVSAVLTRQVPNTPAVAADQADNPLGNRLLAMTWDRDAIGYRLVGAEPGPVVRDLPDALAAPDPLLGAAVKSTVGTDELASAGAAHDALADLGVGFVSIAGASTEPLVNQLDATAGVTRLSNNNGLILWRVLPRGSAIGSSRVRLVDATGAPGVDPCHRRPRSNRCRHRSCHGRICSWASARGGRAEPVGSPRRRDVRRTTACHRGGRAAADVPSAAHRWSAQHHPCADLPAVALGAAGPAARRTVHDPPVRINGRQEDALRGVLRPSALARPVALVAVGVGLALAPPICRYLSTWPTRAVLLRRPGPTLTRSPRRGWSVQAQRRSASRDCPTRRRRLFPWRR